MAETTARLKADELKAVIREALNISQVAEALGVDLQASGDQWRGLCPLHTESTPSFYVHDAKGVYKCWGCEAGGDTIDLVERAKNLSFPEALHWLAAQAGLDIADYERPLTEDEKEQRRFREWCEGFLTYRSDEPIPQRLPARQAAQFAVVIRHGIATEPSGYFNEKAYLGDGVILPWRHPSGRLVGWRVREHEGREKRVVGTPNDFPLGKLTEQTLFGIQIAREHIEDGQLIAVEGEYDTMALHAVGVRNVVGLGGKVLTAGQLELLESLRVRELVIVLDGDDAGRLAAKGLAERYWLANLTVRIAICPEGEDPESMVQKYGDWGFLSLVDGAPVALEHLLRVEWSARDRGTLSSKLEFVKWIRETYGGRLRSSEESLVLKEVASWLGIPELEVRDFVRLADTHLCAPDSERVLIGEACRNQRFYVYLRAQLAREDFFVLKHQRIWDMLADALIDGHDPDALMLTGQAPKYGLPEDYLMGCLEQPAKNLEYHKEQVADLALRRETRDDALAFKDQILDRQRPADLLVGDLTHQITSKALRKSGGTERQLSEQVDQAMDTLHERMRSPTEIHGLDLGAQYPRLSRMLQGLQPRRLILVAAISRVGKSTLLATWAASLAVHQSIPIDFISLEMDETELLFKLASHITGIDSLKISGGALDDREAQVVEQAMARIRNSPLHIWTPDGMTGTEFLLYAREAKMQRRTQAFFVDYVQLIDPEPGQERESGYVRFGEFGRLAKMKIARGMEVPVICAGQLRREAADKDRPTAEDMADSYAIVRHSDVVIILHGREESHTLELWVDKNRQGAGGALSGLVPMVYERATQTFYEAHGAIKRPEYALG